VSWLREPRAAVIKEEEGLAQAEAWCTFVTGCNSARQAVVEAQAKMQAGEHTAAAKHSKVDIAKRAIDAHVLEFITPTDSSATTATTDAAAAASGVAEGAPKILSHGADPTPNCIGVDGVMLGKVGSGRFKGKTCDAGWNGAPTQSVAGHKRCRG
jgi:hypothetical protein